MLGVNVEIYQRGAHADYLSPYRPWDRGRAEAGAGQDALPLRPVRRHRGERARVARPDRRAGRRARARPGLDRRARAVVSAWSTSWAASADAIDEAVRRVGVPVGRDKVPEIDHAAAGAARACCGGSPAAPTAARAAGTGQRRRPPRSSRQRRCSPRSCAPPCACSPRRCSAAATASRPDCPTTSSMR